jgi:hypothetical protein
MMESNCLPFQQDNLIWWKTPEKWQQAKTKNLSKERSFPIPHRLLSKNVFSQSQVPKLCKHPETP